ncbi:MAG: hypothetical protein QW819_04330 [Candidatus Korarchaeota archaeon]|nr:hypothetical protein [Thermoproteota archaeon]
MSKPDITLGTFKRIWKLIISKIENEQIDDQDAKTILLEFQLKQALF